MGSIAAWPAIVTMLGYAILYSFGFGKFVFNAGTSEAQKKTILMLFGIVMAVAVVLVVAYDILCKRVKYFSKNAYEVPVEGAVSDKEI